MKKNEEKGMKKRVQANVLREEKGAKDSFRDAWRGSGSVGSSGFFGLSGRENEINEINHIDQINQLYCL